MEKHTITWLGDTRAEQLIARLNDRAGMEREIQMRMDLIMSSVPSRPWWKFWAKDPHEEYEKWKASKK